MTGMPRAATLSEPMLDLMPLHGTSAMKAAFGDVRAGFALLPLAMSLGWLDIKLRYRGSMLGPFWLTISTAVMVGALGLLYAELFHMNLSRYLPFLSLSLVLWAYMSATINEAPMIFTQSAGLMHAMRMPVTMHVLRAIIRNTLVLLHNIVVIAVVFTLYHVWPRHLWVLAPVLLLWLFDSMAVATLLGLLGARFRDTPPIVASLMQIFFFVTPVIWQPDLIYAGRQYLLLDPFYPIIEILRGPLLGESLRPSIWYAALAHSAVLWGIALVVFARFRARIAYWV
ncbi:sugar ABC transporter permease [Neoasaia chiangmaiensis]|nr:ABC transporter permease [Neoasaia chiangmaiensis]GEN13570.1 sugar ABC transporter permease [Neoasaia chiangmaiensis]